MIVNSQRYVENSTKCSLWGWWTLATVLGLPVAGWWGCLHLLSPDLRPLEAFFAPIVHGALAVVFQAVVFGLWLRSTWWWVWLPLTAAGAALGLWVGIVASLSVVMAGLVSDAKTTLWFAIGLASGLAIGAFQAIALTRTSVPRGLWQAISTMAGPLMPVTVLFVYPFCETALLSVGGLVLGTGIYGLLTGAVLAKYL
jgi:hypothetical protein